MNRFDFVAKPLTTCFNAKPDMTPYKVTPNNVPLDERNKPAVALSSQGKQMLAQSLKLDWSHIDGPNPEKLRRINWFSLTGGRPYPDHLEAKMGADND